MSEVATERVLVIPTEVFHRVGHFQGFSADTDHYLPAILDPAHTSYLERSKAEEDPSFKQLIPYVIFRHVGANGQTSVFQYRRGKGQGEGRLHSKRSVGIGGHISTLDEQQHIAATYEEGMRRELNEEVAILSPYTSACVGLINDDLTEVGKVHLGVVHLFDMESPTLDPREHDLLDAGFRPVADLMNELDQFETWSQICLQALFGK